MRIYTSYYGNVKKLKKAGITPVGISVQRPKWFEGDFLTELAPTYDMLGMEKVKYKELFDKILSEVDVKNIIKELHTVGDEGDVALLCYEGLHTEGEWCHRTMVADWLKEKGFEVGEFIKTSTV